eukprot:TRINITY_DN5165_c0_g1_i1.p1 TRINITY_DN5165_c0_g1~~TRINITY_DN5165_c0_g1_i1.p1  ORF type:complete len:522 (-),score=180.24 TRINITY_DN5165_c0_g1_i1:274-1839(-)
MADARSDSESEGERDRKAAPKPREVIPDAVDHFLGQLNDYIQVRNTARINEAYETTFNELSKRHYASSRWPSAETVAEELGIEDHKTSLFIILYKELYYRHIYTRGLASTFEDRVGSWQNYSKLLELFIDDLSRGETLSVGLPKQWLWDILDEFVYHYQTYCHNRNKTIKIGKEAEVAKLKEHPDVFETTKVLTLLHELVKHSLVENWLGDPSSANGRKAAFTDDLVRHAGYFSMLQLLRLHCMLGDYRQALKTIEKIDFQAEVPLYYTLLACHITLYYYQGFCYLMLRRYFDAITTFSGILVFLSKASAVNNLSYQCDVMLKKEDQMYSLLLICNALCPQPLEDCISKKIRDKYAEKQGRLLRGEDLSFEELFSYACPKFISPALPDFDTLENFNANEAHKRQLELFLQEVRQQQALPKIGAYMKLYTSLKAEKLAQLCEMDKDGLRDQLMCVIHKTRQLVHTTGIPPLDGTVQACAEVEFYLDGDIIHINSHKPIRPHAEVFLEHILKFQDILNKMGRK